MLNPFKRESLSFQIARPAAPFLLAADVDGTMIGDSLGEAWLQALKRDAADGFWLACVTGRDFAAVMQLVAENHLPEPDFICGEVGTEIHDLRDPSNRIGERYAAQVGPDWDPETLFALGAGRGVRPQASLFASPGFHVGFDWDGQQPTLEAFLERISAVPFCHVIASHGRYIDVLPDALGKGRAVAFLQKELGLDPERVIVAGDSGNDREMFETRFKGIVPANALDELKAVASRPWHYHSPLPAGRGVLDGLSHFGFLEPLTPR